MDSTVTIRRFIRDDLNVLLGMTKEEGWGFSHVDCRASLELDSNGLLVAEDNLGAPVGFIGLYTQLPGMTYLATFVVRKDLRGKRIGKKLWSAMLNATTGNILVLGGVSEMKQWYTTQGFNYEAYWIKCYKGKITSKENVTNHSTFDFVPISDELWPALVAYGMVP